MSDDVPIRGTIHFMRIIWSMLCLSLLAVAAGCHSSQGDGRSRTGHKQTAEEQAVTATVKYLDLEGGFYGLVTDEGRKLDPVNLPEAFRQDGVRIRARLERLTGRASTHMWGELVRIVSIERLKDAPPADRARRSPAVRSERMQG
jgi:hypothetical protein